MRSVTVSGKVICQLEPMGDGGLEGYNSGGIYKYEEMQDERGVYYRVYPDETSYYETCSKMRFSKYFEIVCSECLGKEKMFYGSPDGNEEDCRTCGGWGK